jgi:hypothetical protein
VASLSGLVEKKPPLGSAVEPRIFSGEEEPQTGQQGAEIVCMTFLLVGKDRISRELLMFDTAHRKC